MRFESKTRSFASDWVPIVVSIVISVVYTFLAVWNGPEEDNLMLVMESMKIEEGCRWGDCLWSYNAPLLSHILAALRVSGHSLSYLLLTFILQFIFQYTTYKFFVAATIGMALPVSIVAGLWYMPLMGGVYYDHASLLALWVGMLAVFRSETPGGLRLKVVLLLASISILVKHTVGFVGSGALVLAVLIKERLKWPELLGVVNVVVATVAILILMGYALYQPRDWNLIWEHFVVSPLQFARHTDNKSLSAILSFIMFPYNVEMSDFFNTEHKGRLLFSYSAIFPIYIVYIVFLVKALRGSVTKSDLLVFYFLIITLASCSIVGRNYIQIYFMIIPIIGLLIHGFVEGRGNRKVLVTYLILVFLSGSLFYTDLLIKNPGRPNYDAHFVKPTHFPHAKIIEMERLVTKYKPIGKIAAYDDNWLPIFVKLNVVNWAPLASHNLYLNVPEGNSDFKMWTERQLSQLNREKVDIVMLSLCSTSRTFRDMGDGCAKRHNIFRERILKDGFALVEVIDGLSVFVRESH